MIFGPVLLFMVVIMLLDIRGEATIIVLEDLTVVGIKGIIPLISMPLGKLVN